MQRYVMLEQDSQAATVFAREATAGSALLTGDVLAMPEIGIELPLANSTKAGPLATTGEASA